MEGEPLSGAKATEGSGMVKREPDITVNLGGRWHSVVCINTSRVQTQLTFKQGKLDKVEQTETITIPK